MSTVRIGFGALTSVMLLTACTFTPLESPTPSPSPIPTPSPTEGVTPSSAPATPSPSPPPIVPDFAAGEIIVTSTDGLRVRSLPGLQRPVIAGLLPISARLGVVMGPITVEDRGWYLVNDLGPGEPEFDEGWVAAGFEPDPLLAATGSSIDDSPYVASMDGVADAEQGPIEIGASEYAIRWIAVDPERTRCSFAVTLTPAGGGNPVPAIRATIGTGVDRGILQPQSFGALGVRGPTFVSVTSDCGWALVLLEIRPPASAPASPSP